MKSLALLPLLVGLAQPAPGAETTPITGIPVEVDFSRHLQPWDGFGFNYVEAAQTRDYAAQPQDYGGFSHLSAEQREEIVRLVFGRDGLDVGILKMFLDPWHQAEPGGPFDHETTTRHMLEFAEAGARLREEQGRDLTVLTTLYGPPPWATMQKHIGGRDLDPAQAENLIDYMLHWVEFLRGRGLEVRYLSLHNEGEDFYRWTFDTGEQRLEKFDYNAHWRPEEVNAFLETTAAEIARRGIEDLHVTNGEPSNWTRFYHWGYAAALRDDPDALRGLGLLTTHGFINGDMRKLSYATVQGLTTDLVREARPELHAWVTSMAWGEMDTVFVRMVQENIVAARANAVIPWSGVNHGPSWIGGDPTGGTAIRVHAAGRYELTRGYFFYKQLTTAGHGGMAVAYSSAANPQVHTLAFAGADSAHPDAFVVSDSVHIWGLPLAIRVRGTDARRFRAFRTTEDGKERYEALGVFEVTDGVIAYDPPTGSTTTFIAMP
jgi:O-glycosyl hydrolase